nr:uncharacterized protein LOC111421306 [Onthophagus taurus]
MPPIDCLNNLKQPKSLIKRSPKSKIFPIFKNKSAEEFYTKTDSSDDCEFDGLLKHSKNVAFKNEEKSQLICYKDNNKTITIKNDSKLTKYNTFDMKCPSNNENKRGNIIKYKSLDGSEHPRTIVKYFDSQSNVSINAKDFDSDFRRIKYETINTKKSLTKHDIICDTVDAWSKKPLNVGNKNVFSNIRSSIFKGSPPDKEIVRYKPLIFGGTYPIDAPLKSSTKFDEKLIDFEVRNEPKKIVNLGSNHLYRIPKVREYGPAKSFDIDIPI